MSIFSNYIQYSTSVCIVQMLVHYVVNGSYIAASQICLYSFGVFVGYDTYSNKTKGGNLSK